jgi:hypothetical protein
MRAITVVPMPGIVSAGTSGEESALTRELMARNAACTARTSDGCSVPFRLPSRQFSPRQAPELLERRLDE